MEDWEKYIETIAGLVNSREKYQRLLGQIALEVRRTINTYALKDLAEDVKERHGIKISWKTLYKYSWVENKLIGIDLPEDISYRTRELIARSKDPKKYADMLY